MEGELRGLFEQSAGFVTGIALVSSGKTPAVIAGVFLLGAVYARNLEFAHQCLHNTAFGSRRANRIIGTILSLPMLVSFTEWRREHMQHHRDVRREGFRYELDRLTTKRELLLHIFMVRHFLSNGRIVAAAGLAGALGLLLRSPLPVLLVLAPLPVAALVHTHIELPEHLDCERSSRDALRNSRVMRAGPLVTWFVHFNNYHAVHHWKAGVPNRKLPVAYRTAPVAFAKSSYAAFYRSFYRRFFGG